MSVICVSDDADPDSDCVTLRSAMDGLGCNKNALMDIICHRNQKQRSVIRQMYQDKYKEDLIKRLRSELHGNLEDAVALWMCDPAERDAILINKELRAWINKDLTVVAEIMYSRTPLEMSEIHRVYYAAFNCALEQDIGLKATGDEKKLLLDLVRHERPNVLEPDMKTVESDAEALVAAASKSPIQKFSISKIITSRCPAQMRETLEHYKGRYRHSLGKVIKQETKGNFQVLLRVLMRYAKNPVNYFVKALYKSMKGLGTDDPTLIRIIVMRAEIDMEEIKRSFYLKYSSSLQSMIVSDTSGSYQTFLLSLCGATLSEIQAVSSLKHRFSTRKP